MIISPFNINFVLKSYRTGAINMNKDIAENYSFKGKKLLEKGVSLSDKIYKEVLVMLDKDGHV
jgi:hypothetical protein